MPRGRVGQRLPVRIRFTIVRVPPWISYREVEDRTIILDVRANRYFMISSAAADALSGTDPLALPPGLRGILQQSCDGPQSISTACANLPAHLEHSAEAGRTAPTTPQIMKAAATIVAMRFQLRAFSLDRLLWKAQRRNRECSAHVTKGTLGNLISAFEVAERVIIGRDRCLLRSLALQAFLANYGRASALVFGVRLHPFRAHCWLQQGSTVLNDTLEVIGSFHVLRTVA